MPSSTARVRISVLPRGLTKERNDAIAKMIGTHDAITQSDNWDLQVVDRDALDASGWKTITDRPESLERTVVISSACAPEDLRKLVTKDIRHIIGKASGADSAVQLTLRQVALGTPTKLTDYTAGRIDRMWTLISSDEVERVIVEVSAELQRRGINRRIAENFETATDELLSNAFFDAPNGSRERKSRKSSVQTDSNPVFVELSVGKEHFGLCVRDSFGNTTADTIVDSLVRGLAKTPQQIEGAGGLGLMMTLQAVSHLIFTLSPSRFTEATILSCRQPNFRSLRASAKSFNVFQIG